MDTHPGGLFCGGFLKWGYPDFDHQFLDGIFHQKNHPASLGSHHGFFQMATAVEGMDSESFGFLVEWYDSQAQWCKWCNVRWPWCTCSWPGKRYSKPPTWWLTPRIVSRLVHPGYKFQWDKWGQCPLIPRVITHLLSRMNHQVVTCHTHSEAVFMQLSLLLFIAGYFFKTT